jgi:exosortase A-associated hydrolase 1
MTAAEEPVVFECGGERLIGVLAGMHARHSTGVLIVVGGPQYRVGSHRQFVLLARALAAAGYPSFRFDYRGMGDSSGEQRTFESVEPDLCAAASVFRARVPTMRALVIFGLCDAASAILMAVDRIGDVAGLILANPWVRRTETQNAVVVRHYYAGRLTSGEFWAKLFSGRVSIARSLAEAARRLAAMVRVRLTGSSDVAARDFVDRMRAGWNRFAGDRLVILSERDLTAREFEELLRGDPAWSRGPPGARTTIRTFRGADHTFSDARHRIAVESACVEFLRTLNPAQ